MKLTLIAENNYRISIGVPENKANEILGMLVSMITDKKISELPTAEKVNVDMHFTNTGSTAPIQNTRPSETSKTGDYTTHKLIVNTCKKCGEETFRKIEYLPNEETLFKCHFCGDKEKIEKISIASITCPNCAARYMTNVMNDTQLVHCRSCKSPVDLHYNDKKQAYESVCDE